MNDKWIDIITGFRSHVFKFFGLTDVATLRRKAHRGDSDAQRDLGGCYLLGRGVSQDLVQAYAWFYLSLDPSKREVQKNHYGSLPKIDGRGMLLKAVFHGQITPEQIEEGVRLSKKLADEFGL